MSKLQARNEAVINAPIGSIWGIITDIDQLHKINPGVIKASGTMNKLNGTRTCQINNRGKVGNMTERLIEILPEKRTVWTIDEDDMGMSKMLKEPRFCFHLEKINDHQTRVINETYYKPANFIAAIMNVLMMKKMIAQAQTKILENLRTLTQN